jgi:hypothetical protein
MQRQPTEENMDDRIKGVRKYTPVGKMRQLLQDITGEKRWTNDEYYRAFAVRLSILSCI